MYKITLDWRIKFLITNKLLLKFNAVDLIEKHLYVVYKVFKFVYTSE